MKALRLLRWSGSILSPRTRPCCFIHQHQYRKQFSLPENLRLQSTASVPLDEPKQNRDDEDDFFNAESVDQHLLSSPSASETESILRALPSPPPSRAHKSSRLSALHARLMLPPRLPLETLARCLVDPSADTDAHFNNASLSVLGNDLLGLYTSEAILCRYPRLPTEVTFAAMWAYCSPKTLAAVTREWGVEVAAAPGGEVDPGYLQCIRQEAGNAAVERTGKQLKELPKIAEDLGATRPNPQQMAQRGWRRGVSSRTIYDDYFGDTIKRTELDYAERPELRQEDAQRKASRGVTLENASTGFVRALVGAVYLHAGKKAAYNFFKAHILSRHLDVSKLFEFRQPTRDLSKLCAREGFESPVARILSETGRKSRTPVYVVGVFAGKDKLGEGAGASLDEARIRAAVAALKGWYLYSPLEVRVPSQAEAGKVWEPVLVDGGEVVA
ncbi:large subunit ribosomal protein L44, partial [Lecanoromycetidae sp. Uapishka_2]